MNYDYRKYPEPYNKAFEYGSGKARVWLLDRGGFAVIGNNGAIVTGWAFPTDHSRMTRFVADEPDLKGTSEIFVPLQQLYCIDVDIISVPRKHKPTHTQGEENGKENR
jgi:hypothetical protein